MPNNINVGPNFVVAKATANISSIGAITADSVNEIFGVVGGIYKVYKPNGGAFNTLTQFIIDNGYQINAKTAMDLTANVVPPVEAVVVPTAEAIVWSQLAQATNGSGGDLTATSSTTPAGGTATKKLAKATGNYVQMVLPDPLSGSDAAVLALVEDNDAAYTWATFESLASAYQNGGTLYALNSPILNSPVDTGAIAAGAIVRLEISGDNIIVRSSTNGTTFNNEHTFTGVLTGITDIFIKGVFAAPSAGNIINNATGLGLVAI